MDLEEEYTLIVVAKDKDASPYKQHVDKNNLPLIDIKTEEEYLELDSDDHNKVPSPVDNLPLIDIKTEEEYLDLDSDDHNKVPSPVDNLPLIDLKTEEEYLDLDSDDHNEVSNPVDNLPLIDIKIEEEYLDLDSDEHNEVPSYVVSDDDGNLNTNEGFLKENIKIERESDEERAENSSASQVPLIKELFAKRPALRRNKSALVKVLVREMDNVRPPTISEDSYMIAGQVYLCTECKHKDNSKANVIRHFILKHGPRYLVCYACGADFRSTSNLYKHEKRCKAPHAAKLVLARDKFLERAPDKRVRNHRQTKNKIRKEDRRFECKLCPAVFKLNRSLQTHERVHRGERPFKCDQCTASYASGAILWKHRFSHLDPSYTCDHCGQAFKYKTTLASHIHSHFSPRFACAECDRRFTYKSALHLHVHKMHRNLPMPCACPVCPRRFGRMWCLNDHMKKNHGLALMTRRMFFQQLPKMDQVEIQKAAKLVMRHTAPIISPSELKFLHNKEPPASDISTGGKLNFETGLIV